jgi:Na+-translocating ferredoxin:NAD+ oxidoreductase RnfE subunit
MNTSLRVLLDLAVRSVTLLVLSEAVAALYAAAEPNDDGLGTGLTVMFVLVCAAAGWGLWDGFHRSPVRLCVTWVTIGLVVSIGTTLYSQLRFGEWSWAELATDLSSGLVFWASLIFVPAILCGIGQSSARRSDTRARSRESASPHG